VKNTWQQKISNEENAEKFPKNLDNKKIKEYLGEDPIIISDFEYIFPNMSSTSGRPSKEAVKEMVQIGAIKFDPKTCKITDFFNKIIKPYIINDEDYDGDFFENLTGISKEVMENGDDFEHIIGKFEKFVGNNQIYTMCNDYEVMQKNCEMKKIDNPFSEFKKVKPLLQFVFKVPNMIGKSSGELHEIYNIKKEDFGDLFNCDKDVMKKIETESGRWEKHNALYDVFSLTSTLLTAISEKQQNKEINF
jgi:hypothetical protein